MDPKNWFDVSKSGLSKLLEKRGKSFACMELISNCLDTNATAVAVTLQAIPDRPLVRLLVRDDDPQGFQDLSHAWTLFAESSKKADAEKRGRFNLGEKLVLALCQSARITTTTGTVIFDDEGRHQNTRNRTDTGSLFEGILRMTRAEMVEAEQTLRTILPPPTVALTLNDVPIPSRKPLATVSATLPTEISDSEGILRRTARKTEVRIYPVLDGETAHLYELGIPVVETLDRFHVDVAQKVPLNMDRDNVTPAFLRQVRVLTLNATPHLITTMEDANQNWVRDAGSSPDASDAAIRRIAQLRFGELRVIHDPSDPEANALAVTRGYTVVHGGMLSSGEWDNVRRSKAVLPAGQVTPSPKPFSPDGKPLQVIDPSQYTQEQRDFAEFASRVGNALTGQTISVTLTADRDWGFKAAYGSRHLTVNVSEGVPTGTKRDALLIHEFAHSACSNHLSEEFYRACCLMGARLTQLALTNPATWKLVLL